MTAAPKTHAVLGGGSELRRAENMNDARVADAFGSTYEQYNQGWVPWAIETAKGAGKALNQPATAEDFWDLMKAVPSAAVNIGTNIAGFPGDVDEMLWDLSDKINQGRMKLGMQDNTLDRMRLRKQYGTSWPTAEEIQGGIKPYLAESLTYEPERPLGQLLHTGADFVEVGGPAAKGLKWGMKALK